MNDLRWRFCTAPMMDRNDSFLNINWLRCGVCKSCARMHIAVLRASALECGELANACTIIVA